jgi:hypothetical protein
MGTKARTKPLAPGRTEAQVLAQVLEAAAMFGDAIEIERQNTGGLTDPRGQYVPFGQKGDADLRGQVRRGPNAGKLLHCEVKKELFDPRKLRGEARAHFDRQRARLVKTNDGGGLGFWVNDAADFTRVLKRALDTPGLRIAFEGDWPMMEWD